MKLQQTEVCFLSYWWSTFKFCLLWNKVVDNQSLCLTVWLVFSKTVKDHKISSADFIISFAPFEISSLRFLRFSYKPLNEWRNVKMTDVIPNLYIRLEEFSLHKQISNKISYRRRKLKLWSRFQAVLLSGKKKLQWNDISLILWSTFLGGQ